MVCMCAQSLMCLCFHSPFPHTVPINDASRAICQCRLSHAMCTVPIAHFTLESMTWLQFVLMVVHQSTVHPQTFSYISFIHAGDKSHHEACLHLPQFLYFAALLSCFAAHISSSLCREFGSLCSHCCHH